MEASLIKFEPWIRVACFVGFFLLLAWAEQKRPWRFYAQTLKPRWGLHITLVMIGTLLLRAVAPVLLIELAIQVRLDHPWALLSMPEVAWLPFWAQVVLGVVALDFVMYWQHRAMHRIGLLWRIHLAHHTDQAIDASTGIRFHPIEFFVSYGFKMLGIIFFGPPALAVLIFEVILNASSMFTHANITFSKKFNKRLRWFVVTPQMHRVHHSDIVHERNSNFGFFLSVWDRMLKTYRPFSRMGEQRVVIGVEEYLQEAPPNLWQLFIQPFVIKRKRRRKPPVRKWMRLNQNDR